MRRAAAKPNIVMIVADDAGYNDVHFDSNLLTNAATTAETPNLDALAGQSVVMRQGILCVCPFDSCAGRYALGRSRRVVTESRENLPNDINNTFGLPHNQKLLPAVFEGPELPDDGDRQMARRVHCGG